MKKSGLLLLIPLLPLIPPYLLYVAAQQILNPDCETLRLVAAIRILSARTRLYRARLSGLAESEQIEQWHIRTSELHDDLERWKARRAEASLVKRRKCKKELQSLEKKIAEHDCAIEQALQDARRKRVELALKRPHPLSTTLSVNDEI